MDWLSFVIGIVVGIACSAVAFALTVLLYPRLFTR